MVKILDLDFAIGRAAACLRAGGFGTVVRDLVDELYVIDKVSLLAELRFTLLDQGFGIDEVARCNR